MLSIIASEQSEIGPIPAGCGFAGRQGEGAGHNRPFLTAAANLYPRLGTKIEMNVALHLVTSVSFFSAGRDGFAVYGRAR